MHSSYMSEISDSSKMYTHGKFSMPNVSVSVEIISVKVQVYIAYCKDVSLQCKDVSLHLFSKICTLLVKVSGQLANVYYGALIQRMSVTCLMMT